MLEIFVRSTKPTIEPLVASKTSRREVSASECSVFDLGKYSVLDRTSPLPSFIMNPNLPEVVVKVTGTC